MKSILSLTAVCLATVSFVQANQISESQQPFVEKYKNQKHIVDPAEAMLNTEPEPELGEGFENLYNGENLDGWVARGGYAKLEAGDGYIAGTCVPGSPSTYLCTEREFDDFIFTAELKWEVNSNSGIMFRSKSKPGKKYEVVYGPQCEMEGFSPRGWSGGIFGQSIGGWRYPLWLDAHKEARAALKQGEWNRVTIKAVGGNVKTWINGVPAANWNTDEYLSGFFALQIHSGTQGKVLFRNLKVKELGSNQISESQQPYIEKYKNEKHIVDPAEAMLNTEPEPGLCEGFEDLYNGENLDGWVARGGYAKLEAGDGYIVGTCVPGSPSTYLCTEREFDDFIFTAEVKWEVNSNSGIMFRSDSKPGKKYELVYGPQCEMEGYSPRGWSGGIYGQSAGGWRYPLWLDAHKEARAALKRGEWNRVTIKAVGGNVKTWINGVPAANWNNDEYLSGFFALQIHSGTQGKVLFRNLKVKELESD